MPRGLRWTVVLVVLGLTAAAAVAQPRGGGAGQATPTPPPLIANAADLFEDPEQAFGEFVQIAGDAVLEFVTEQRVRIEANRDALPAALTATVTRVAALVLGLALLALPNRLKNWSWVFFGAVVGLVVAQLPIGEEIRFELFRNDLEFLIDEPFGTIGLVVGGALFGFLALQPAFYFAMTMAGGLAGAIAAGQLVGGFESIATTPAPMVIGGVLGFVAMLVAMSRAQILVTLAVGAALVVFAAGLGPSFMIPLVIVGALVAVGRSPRGRQLRKREILPSLELKEGKVQFEQDPGPRSRQHLHEILPAMADDRDNPLIKR